MKVKWSQVMKAFHNAGFTDEQYGLIYEENELDGSIGIEEYSCGLNVHEALNNLGIEVEDDMFGTIIDYVNLNK